MRRFLILMVSAALVVAALPAAGIAQTDDDDEGLLTLHPELSAGPWFGSGSAGGITTADVGDMHMVFTADYDAVFFFDVTTDGVTTGEWDIQGPVQLNATSPQSSFLMIGDLAGTGPISGDAVKLSVDGSTTTNGTATISAGGQTFTQQVSNAAGNPTIDIEVTTTFCNEAYGDWIVSVNQRLEDFSWEPTFRGSWVATRNIEWFEEMSKEERAALIGDHVELIDDFNEWVLPAGHNEWRTAQELATEWDTAVQLLARMDVLVNKLRNLSQCDRELFGEDRIEQYLNGLTKGVGIIIALGVEGGTLSGSDIRLLVDVGLRVGAIGAGSVLPNAASLMEGLRLAAEQIYIANIKYSDDEDPNGDSCSNGCLQLTQEVRDVLVAGWQAGWTFTITGKKWVPGNTITNIVGIGVLGGES